MAESFDVLLVHATVSTYREDWQTPTLPSSHPIRESTHGGIFDCATWKLASLGNCRWHQCKSRQRDLAALKRPLHPPHSTHNIHQAECHLHQIVTLRPASNSILVHSHVSHACHNNRASLHPRRAHRSRSRHPTSQAQRQRRLHLQHQLQRLALKSSLHSRQQERSRSSTATHQRCRRRRRRRLR